MYPALKGFFHLPVRFLIRPDQPDLLKLFHLFQCTCDPPPAGQKPSESRTDISNLYFQKASEYIRNNYAYPIQISDVAHYVGIDRSYLYRIFMEHENTSPKQYLLKHRLQMAAQLLCSSSCTITEVALSCGFRDAPSFCNYFRQGTGYTPKEFRKAYSGTIYT
mgnify:FL=1